MGGGRKALVVGIDYYEKIEPLSGCVDDAHAVKQVLDRHADGTRNFDTKLMTGNGQNDKIGRKALRDEIKELFAGDEEIALLYFAGHGYIEATGGYLCASDTSEGDDGLSLSDVLTFANQSRVSNKIILLDSCHSGVAGTEATGDGLAQLSHGLTILTASTAEQYAFESDEGGVFTNLLVDALNGAAANLLGEITPGSVYAHIDQ